MIGSYLEQVCDVDLSLHLLVAMVIRCEHSGGQTRYLEHVDKLIGSMEQGAVGVLITSCAVLQEGGGDVLAEGRREGGSLDEY